MGEQVLEDDVSLFQTPYVQPALTDSTPNVRRERGEEEVEEKEDRRRRRRRGEEGGEEEERRRRLVQCSQRIQHSTAQHI